MRAAGFCQTKPGGYANLCAYVFESVQPVLKLLRLADREHSSIVSIWILASSGGFVEVAFKRFDEAALIMATLPFALVGGFWLLYLLGYNLSVAGAIGFIALAGVAAEFGVIMLLYLKLASSARQAQGATSEADLLDAIREGAVQRVRPKEMTVDVILAGLLPIMFGGGTGSEVMQRIAAPMVGGMLTAPLLSMFVVPAAYLLMRRRRTRWAGV